MTNLPEPLVSAEIDLHGMSSFMLDTNRLLASELVALGRPEECWAAVMLWCRAWQQSPPASLPDDDRILSAFSGAGKNWAKVKKMALRGFMLCSDGRLYHPVLAAEAMKGWKKRQTYDADQGRLKRWRNAKRNGAEPPSETPDETHFKPDLETPSRTVGQGQGQGQVAPLTPRSVDDRQSSLDPEFRLPGVEPCPGDGRPAVNGWYLDSSTERILTAAGIEKPRSAKDLSAIVRWLEEDITPDTIVAAIRRVASRAGYQPPATLAFFDGAVREQRAAVST